MDRMSETGDLLKRIARGDADAADAFFAATFRPLYRFVLFRVGGSESLAEDIVQEVFMKVVEKAADFRGQSEPFTWMCQMAKNRITDHWRREGTRKKWWDSMTTADAQFQSTEASQLPDDLDEDKKHLIHASLSALEPLFQSVLESRYFEGLGSSEIAKKIGRSEKAVESLLYRARKAFKAHYEILLREMSHG